MTASSFADYCRSRGLRCVLRDGCEENENGISMIFSDEAKVNPDVRVNVDFTPEGDIYLYFEGFAIYKGVPERREVLRRLNSINTATPFANYILLDDQIIQALTVIRGTVREQELLELIFFNVHAALNVLRFIFYPSSKINPLDSYLEDTEQMEDEE